MPLIIPAIIGGVASVAGAAISSAAATHAGNVAAKAASANTALQGQVYQSDKTLIQPTVDRGNAAADALQGFLGLGGDPGKIQGAFNAYLKSTGYQFNRQQGLDAVTQSAAAKGLLGSGATLKALDAYGTGEADQYGQQYAANLAGVANRGVQGVNALTGAATNYANQVSGANTTAATASANAGMATAGAANGLIANALAAYGLARGASSYGAAYNPFAPGG